MISIRSLRRANAFTLVELMVATVVLVIILLMLVAMVNQTSSIWRSSATKAEQFRSARIAFDSITRQVSQATLNTYFDYKFASGSNQPQGYQRQSDLRFIVGACKDIVPSSRDATITAEIAKPGHAIFFQAPLGFVSSDQATLDPNAKDPVTGNAVKTSLYVQNENLLNTWGYFLEYSSDRNYRPPFLNTSTGSFQSPPERYRYRLMEFMVPSDQINIYQYTSRNQSDPNVGPYIGRDWFDTFLKYPAAPQSSTNGQQGSQVRPAHLLAENIVMLVLRPQLSLADQAKMLASGSAATLAPGYSYDTAQTAAPTDPRVDPRNQLPPVVQVTMVAIDEASAARLDARNNSRDSAPPSDLSNAMSGKFTAAPSDGNPQTGNAASRYDQDLSDLQTELVKKRVTYRSFTTSVSLRGAKWSRD